jgi:hypothetical protein
MSAEKVTWIIGLMILCFFILTALIGLVDAVMHAPY